MGKVPGTQEGLTLFQTRYLKSGSSVLPSRAKFQGPERVWDKMKLQGVNFDLG